MDEKTRARSRRPKNIVLIGMPASGKTVLGRIVAKRMKLSFVDMDKKIEQDAGRSISEIFAAEGEVDPFSKHLCREHVFPSVGPGHVSQHVRPQMPPPGGDRVDFSIEPGIGRAMREGLQKRHDQRAQCHGAVFL